MAVLSPHYELCAVIDQENLLGVEKNSKSNCVIVTYGRNFVMKYDLKDIRHMRSWDCTQRLTTPVIWDEKLQKYAAVFNSTNVHLWQEDAWTLDNVKKHKLGMPLSALLTHKDVPSILVQKSGATAALEWAIENTNSWTSTGFLKDSEQILKCQLKKVQNQLYLCALIQQGSELSFYIVPLKQEAFIEDHKQLRKVELKNGSENLVAHEVLLEKNNLLLLTLWSDNSLYKYSLLKNTSETIPGSFIGKLPHLNAKSRVETVALSENVIAAYGASIDEEKAALIIYHVNFKLVQACEKFDNFDYDAKLWKVETNLLLAANKYLSVVPYKLAPQKVGARLGCLKLKSEETAVIIAKKSKKVSEQISKLQSQGVSNTVIQKELIPRFIESNDIKSIVWCLDNFNDISEDLLILLLRNYLNSQDDSEKLKHNVFEKILISGFSRTTMMKEMRNNLNVEEVIKFLELLIDELESNEGSLNYDKLYCWITTAIDAHYSQYLLCQNPKIPEIFERLAKATEFHYQTLHELDSLRPIVVSLISGVPIHEAPSDLNELYSIEDIKLY